MNISFPKQLKKVALDADKQIDLFPRIETIILTKEQVNQVVKSMGDSFIAQYSALKPTLYYRSKIIKII